MILGEDYYGNNGEHNFWGLSYSSEKTAQKRISKLQAAGIICKTTGWNGGYIRFIGYTPETDARLEKERQEWLIAKKAWDEKNKENSIVEGAERLSSHL